MRPRTTTVEATAATAAPPRGSVAERRQRALERLHSGSVPERAGRRAARRQGAERRRSPGVWDVQRGPAPVAYYVIGVVVAMFVLLGLVMVLSASAGVEAAKGRSPYHIFTRQATWAAIGLVGMIVAMRMHLAWVKRLAIPLVVLAGLGMALPFVPGVGTTVNDARAWVTIGSFSLQPSEFLKLALVAVRRRPARAPPRPAVRRPPQPAADRPRRRVRRRRLPRCRATSGRRS